MMYLLLQGCYDKFIITTIGGYAMSNVMSLQGFWEMGVITPALSDSTLS